MKWIRISDDCPSITHPQLGICQDWRDATDEQEPQS
jgi:hypothetical protein